MKTLTIVVHCWHYEHMLMYQLSSIVKHPPKGIDVGILVLTEEKDHETRDVVGHFQKHYQVGNINFGCLMLCAPKFFNRGWGRDLVARQLKSDLVWFADADYCFGEGCLDSLGDMELKDDWLYYPKQIKQTKMRRGPKYDVPLIDYELRDIDSADFKSKKIARAIGGLQIVTGNTARSRGYHTQDRKRRRNTKVWVRGREEDVRYRRQFKQPRRFQPIDLPNLFRIHQLK